MLPLSRLCGLMCALYFNFAELKNPPHSCLSSQPAHSGMYSFFQSEMLLTAR